MPARSRRGSRKSHDIDLIERLSLRHQRWDVGLMSGVMEKVILEDSVSLCHGSTTRYVWKSSGGFADAILCWIPK